MGTNHVTAADLDKLARGELEPDSIVTVARHIETCDACRAYARRMMDARNVPEAFGLEDVHPAVESELTPYVDGGLTLEQRARIAEHLLWCGRCREDAADLAQMREHESRNRAPRFAYAAAAVVLVAIAGVALFVRAPVPHGGQPPPAVGTGEAPVLHVTAPRPADWEAAVNDAVRTGAVTPPPVLREIRASRDAFRGTTQASRATLEPVGVVIETTQPVFTWTPGKEARYVVTIFDRDREVATSGKIKAASWKPSKHLERGRTFTWQVEVFHGGKSDVIPAPPSPPAMFHVVDETTARELDDARARYPDDHLLLGVLYARAGLQATAEEELRAANTPAAARVLDSVSQW